MQELRVMNSAVLNLEQNDLATTVQKLRLVNSAANCWKRTTLRLPLLHRAKGAPSRRDLSAFVVRVKNLQQFLKMCKVLYLTLCLSSRTFDKTINLFGKTVCRHRGSSVWHLAPDPGARDLFVTNSAIVCFCWRRPCDYFYNIAQCAKVLSVRE